MIAIIVGVWREAKWGNVVARRLRWVYLIFLGTIIHDVLYAQGVIDSVYLASYTIIALIVLKSSELAKEHADALTTSKALSKDLQLRVEERTLELEQATRREIESTKSALRKNMEMAELGRHIAKIGHELHNPIGTTMALYEQLESDVRKVKTHAGEITELVSDEFIQTKLDDIDTGVEVLGVVTKRLEELSALLRRRSSVRPDERERFSLNDVVRETLALLEPRNLGVKVELELLDLPEVSGQRSHLSVLVSNLVSNAIAATTDCPSDESILKVSTRMSKEAHSKQIHLLVEDSGPGVPAELTEKVFEEFFHDEISRKWYWVGTRAL